MLQLFKKKSHEEENKDFFDIFSRDFFANDNHRWVHEDRYIKANFEEFFERLPKKVIRRFVKGPGLLFLPSSGKFSCTLTSVQSHIVIVFPELMKLLRSSATNHALAILAHELGHIVYNHSSRPMDPLEAQVEADNFACELGFANELESFLMDQPDTLEKRVRLTYITSRIVSNF
jgi:hypothetical protein